jgi:hypothetical protein
MEVMQIDGVLARPLVFDYRHRRRYQTLGCIATRRVAEKTLDQPTPGLIGHGSQSLLFGPSQQLVENLPRLIEDSGIGRLAARIWNHGVVGWAVDDLEVDDRPVRGTGDLHHCQARQENQDDSQSRSAR